MHQDHIVKQKKINNPPWILLVKNQFYEGQTDNVYLSEKLRVPVKLANMLCTELKKKIHENK